MYWAFNNHLLCNLIDQQKIKVAYDHEYNCLSIEMGDIGLYCHPDIKGYSIKVYDHALKTTPRTFYYLPCFQEFYDKLVGLVDSMIAETE